MSAIISSCGLYRYRLDRVVGDGPPLHIAFALHNPSTADAETNDPTVVRCIGFARLWGATRMTIINPFAGRSTNPKLLWRMGDPVGPANLIYIEQVAREVNKNGGFILLGWGTPKPYADRRNLCQNTIFNTLALFNSFYCDLRVLAMNKDGSPKHPLYHRSDARPERY